MNLKSLTQPELADILKQMGQPAFRAKQVFSWLHKGVRSYEEMTNLPKALREALAREYPLYAPTAVRRQESQKDGTIKYLWQLSDGNCVETMLMRYRYGNTVCISTEVGCRIRCFLPRWIRDCPFPTLCLWASASPWTIWTMSCAF